MAHSTVKTLATPTKERKEISFFVKCACIHKNSKQDQFIEVVAYFGAQKL
jgi:hypothetical protein